MNKDKSSSNSTLTKDKLQLNLDLRWVIAVLLAIIVGMLVVWKPWDDPVSDRTISVTGETIVSAEPDQYTFNPSYEFTADSRQTAIDDMTAKNEEIISELKGLGVEDSEIKTNSDSYDTAYFRNPDQDTDDFTYNLRLTITLSDKDLAQKVQDYLLTTEPSGSITPYVTFSESKRDQLEDKARDQATKDARAKAEQSAENLGFSLGEVKTVKDDSGFGIFPADGLQASIESSDSSSPRLDLQPGENDINYSVRVVYYVK